jgi:hypothetical protein
MGKEEYVHQEAIDRFAVDFLRMVEDDLFIRSDIRFGWTPQKIIAVFCSDRFWNGQLRDIMSRAEKPRYGMTIEKWPDANGCWCGPLSQDSGKVEGFPEEELRRIRLELGFPREVVEVAARYDIMIFLHESNLNQTRSFWKLPGAPLEVLPEHIVVAHECVHIIEAVSGQILTGRHDFDVYFEVPEVAALFQRFRASMSSSDFKSRYFYTEE